MLRIGVSEDARSRKVVSTGVSSMVFKILFWAAMVIAFACFIINSFLFPIDARYARAINSSVSFTFIDLSESIMSNSKMSALL